MDAVTAKALFELNCRWLSLPTTRPTGNSSTASDYFWQQASALSWLLRPCDGPASFKATCLALGLSNWQSWQKRLLSTRQAVGLLALSRDADAPPLSAYRWQAVEAA